MQNALERYLSRGIRCRVPSVGRGTAGRVARARETPPELRSRPRPTYGRYVKGVQARQHEGVAFAWDKQVWRTAFAFDPRCRAILLAGGNKGGVDQKRFYKRLIASADRRFDEHIASLKPPAKKRYENHHGKNSQPSTRHFARQAAREDRAARERTGDAEGPASGSRTDSGRACDELGRRTGHNLAHRAAQRHAALDTPPLRGGNGRQAGIGRGISGSPAHGHRSNHDDPGKVAVSAAGPIQAGCQVAPPKQAAPCHGMTYPMSGWQTGCQTQVSY